MKQATHAVIMLHPECNMTCNFCITEDNMGQFSFEAARDLITSLKNRNYKTTIFGGGEPFYWPHDLKSLIEYSKSLGFITQVGTNATRLPENYEHWNFVDRWVIPLDGMSDNTHNQMRFFQNRHRSIIIDVLNKLKKMGRTVTISTVLTRINAIEIFQIGEFLKEINQDFNFIHAWHLYQFVSQGRGGAKNHELLSLPESEYDRLVSEVKAMNLAFKIFKRKNMLLSESVEFFWIQEGKVYSQTRSHPSRIFELLDQM